MNPAAPLAGTRVLVVRPARQADELVRRIRASGGDAVVAPTIEIRPGDRAVLHAALHELATGRFTLVCFTSANGVGAVADALEELDLDASVLAHVTVAAVGPGTAQALQRQLSRTADVVARPATTAALGEQLPPGSGRVLLPRADLATRELPDLLEAKGYEPVEVDAYVTVLPAGWPPDVVEQLAAGAIDLLAFTSASTVRNFVTLMGGRPFGGRIVSIGPVTSAACRELGLEVAVEARRHDLDGLVEALADAARSREAVE